MNIILGSQSSGRKEVMERMGIPFSVMSADIDEKSIRRDTPEDLTRAIARAKADALVTQMRGREPAILITADTVVVCNGRVREKAADKEQAAAFLREYGMHALQTVSAVVVTYIATREKKEAVDTATVWFRPIPENMIARMVARDDICNFAGAFAYQDPLQRSFIDRIEGEEESILGLPKALTLQMLTEWKI